MEADYNFLLVVCDPLGILDQKLRPHPIHILNIIIIIIIIIMLINYI
jgi:hypothetical protein